MIIMTPMLLFITIIMNSHLAYFSHQVLTSLSNSYMPCCWVKVKRKDMSKQIATFCILLNDCMSDPWVLCKVFFCFVIFFDFFIFNGCFLVKLGFCVFSYSRENKGECESLWWGNGLCCRHCDTHVMHVFLSYITTRWNWKPLPPPRRDVMDRET